MADKLLLEGLKELDVADYGEKAELLSLYIKELMLFNPALKLVGDKEEKGIIIRHILDCASGYKTFKGKSNPGDTIADLGSGSGLPGIVLAILFEDRNFVLIERMTRRVGFLRGVIAKLRLKNVVVDDRDIKDVDTSFSVLTCRAFHPLYDIAKDTVRLLGEDGVAIMYKGMVKSVKAELNALSEGGYDYNAEIIPIQVPYLDEERVLCVISSWRKI